MNKKFKIWSIILTTIFSILIIFPPTAVQAQQSGVSLIQEDVLQQQDEAFLKATGLGRGDPVIIVSAIIQWLLSLLGVIFIILIIYAGFVWMTSTGNEEKISKAKKIMTAAVIGLAIILSAYVITYFVIDKILEATETSPTGLD